MNVEKIKRVIDACYQGKRIRDLLPPLPDGVAPSFIHYLDVIACLSQQGDVRISDVSDALNLPRPGVTRTVKDMEAKGYLRKIASQTDGRVTYIAMTDKGAALRSKYDERFFAALSDALADVPDEDADCTIRTIGRLYDVMCEGRIRIE